MSGRIMSGSFTQGQPYDELAPFAEAFTYCFYRPAVQFGQLFHNGEADPQAGFFGFYTGPYFQIRFEYHGKLFRC